MDQREDVDQPLQALKQALRRRALEARQVEEALRRIDAGRVWAASGYPNIHHFLRDEIGASAKELQAWPAADLAADPQVKPLARHGANGRGRNRSADRPVGRGSRYWIMRLKRDAPRIAEALANGEFPSVYRACLAAGIIRPRTRLDELRHAWRRASEAERSAFLGEIRGRAT